MEKREMWDAVDENGELLGFDLYRDEGKRIPPGVFHRVVEILAVTKSREVLLTQRDARKAYGLKWEITGGSVLKGESVRQGACRELLEETGIAVSEEALVPIYSDTRHPGVYTCFGVVLPGRPAIRLQPGETVDFQFLPVEAFFRRSADTTFFARPVSERVQAHRAEFEDFFAQL